MMTTESNQDPESKQQQEIKKRRWRILAVAVILSVLTLLVLCVILAFTVFKLKHPRTQLVSATVDGVAPRVSFPALKIELNITLDLEILVENPNRASFKHGPGKSLVFYRGKQVGEVDLAPGRIPARGSETIRARLTIEADEFVSELGNLIRDVSSGELCQVAIGFPDLRVRRQECRNKTKL
uniref:Late embryogenesis abundant protein LEA-2 subgroup domain-containing protein n=1 Tax=Nelumbo nucifera TaxID=4432 RepID=A0A822Z594_NELNU|nr:TPA_asm: hypothetical protein HUJ06_012861 [Nelumbo nucifera]